MTVELSPVGTRSPLYVPGNRPPGGVVTGFLFAPGTTPPPSVTLADALGAQGWFVVAGPVPDAGLAAFIAAAQTWFASSARTGALLSWFTNAGQPGAGLTGWTIFAGPPGSRSALTGTASIQFGNFAISLPRGTGVGASTDGTALQFTTGGAPPVLAVTPYGARTPVTFPVPAGLSLELAGDPATTGCASFSFSADAAGLDALDVGLRSYTAPPAGGYAQTARHRPFDFTQGSVALTAVLDPLAPTDHGRSSLALPGGTQVPSHYRSTAGPAYQAAFGADFRFVLAARLTGVDAAGHPVHAGGPVYTVVPSGTVALSLPAQSGGGGASSLAPTLMGGLSPVEYFGVPSGPTLAFVPDQPAFAPTVRAAADGQGRTFGALSSAATTAWVSLASPAAGTAYFSQPDQGVLHQGDTSGSKFLAYLPLQISSLPQGATGLFPLLPYASVVTGPGLSLDDLGQFERQAWSPTRLATLRPASPVPGSAAVPGGAPRPPPAAAPNPPYGTTRQGLLLQFANDGGWADLTLAMSAPPPPPPRQPGLILESVTGTLRAALQANELFLVISAGDMLLASSDMAYLLSEERVDLLATKISDPDCQAWLRSLVANGEVSYANLAALRAAVLATGAPPAMAKSFDTVRTYAGDFSLFTAGSGGDPGWEFDLSPWRWPEHQTILIFKFCNKQFAQAAADISQWSAAGDFNASPAATAQQIGQILADARTRQQTDPDLTYFVETVLGDATWNGIIALNALVPLSGIPEQMRALAAGIDPAAFQAHHVGVSVTPVTPGASSFTASPSSVFGLIDYEDPAPLASGDDYAFKVNSLKVLIANSLVAGFSSRVELLVNKLFGEPVTQIAAPDNNLVFNGYYQKNGGAGGTGVGTYRFVTTGPTAYSLASAVLGQVAITSATFVTLPGTTDDNPVVNAAFQLNGAIAFLPQKGFDLFSYGPAQAAQTIEQGLSYRSLSIDMSFNEATPFYRTFAFDAAAIVLDPATSLARPASLVSHFPMKLTGLVQGLGAVTPDTLGFMPIDMPVQGTKLSPPWFGLRFDLDLGTPGALAAATGFTAGLLLAWAPNPSGATIYAGLSLPGVSGGQRAISLEGVLSLTFGGIRFVVAPPTYLIQLSNIALKFLSVSFPPGGQVDMTLFGNPAQQSSGALGWFAAYLKNGAGTGSKPSLPGRS